MIPTVETLGCSVARTADVVNEVMDRGGTLCVLRGKINSGSSDDRLVLGMLGALTEYKAANNIEDHSGRDNFIIAQALFEFVKTEEEKPRNRQRSSDMEEAKLILDERFNGELPMLEAAQEAKESFQN